MTALVIDGVHAGYPGVHVLRGVHLEVPDGALVAVLGGSGCGKTTLLRCIAGFHPIDSGTIRIGERIVAGNGVHVPPEKRRIGLVPQEGALFSHLTVADNVGFGLSRQARRLGRVEEMLELVGLADLKDRMPAELSGGQQQRVALARALAPNPALVLLDEPFTALDANLRAEVREQVRAALRAAGATAVLVTHDQQEALSCADLVAVLRDGRVQQVGPPREIYQRPVDVGVGTFVGEAVVLPATARAGRADTVLGALRVEDDRDGTGVVLLRPEQLRLSKHSSGRARGVVAEVLFYGHDATVLVDVDGTTVRCRTGTDTPPLGSTVAVEVIGTARFFPSQQAMAGHSGE